MMQFAKKFLKNRQGLSSQEVDEVQSQQSVAPVYVQYHPCVTDQQLASRGASAAPVNIPNEGPTKRKIPRIGARTRHDSVDGDVDSELSFLQVQSLPDLTGSSDTQVVPDVVPQGQTDAPITSNKEAIKILWPGAAGSVTSSEYEDIVETSLTPPQKINVPVEKIEEGKKDLSSKMRPLSPPQSHSNEVSKQSRQSPQLSLSKHSDKISFNTGGRGSVLSPVKEFIKSDKSKRNRQRNPRYKTLTGPPIVLTDDETLDDRRGMARTSGPDDDREPVSSLRDRRKDGGWRSSSLTEKTPSKTGESTEDLNSSTEVLEVPRVTTVKADAISTSSGSIPVSRLDEFILLAGSELEENQLFTITKAENVVDSKGTLPLPNREALQALKEYQRQNEEGDAAHVAFLCPYVSRSTSSRFTSLSSREMNKQPPGEQNLFGRNSGLSHLLSIANGPVHLSPVLGSQSIGRYLFLFPEFLLIAKQKSISSFKLKMKIPMTDLWVSQEEEFLESFKHPDRSILIGWPVVNTVACFNSPDQKRFWLELFQKQIYNVRNQLDPENKVNHKIVYGKKDLSVTKSLNLLPLETANQFLERCLSEFRLNQSKEGPEYQLRIVSGDIITNTLLGCECPYSIKMAAERDASGGSQGRKKLYSSRHSVYGAPPGADFHIELFEKSHRIHRSLNAGDTPRKGDRARSPLVILFKKPRSDGSQAQQQGQAASKLFGRDLAELCIDDKLPPVIMDLLQFLYTYGPVSEGVFRKTASIKHVSAFRVRLEAGELFSISEASVSLATGLLKEYLRALPDCLLCSGLYSKWIQAANIEEDKKRKEFIRDLMDKMPDGHRQLLRHVICVLERIAENSSYNKMTSANLATCIGPSLLWASSTVVNASQVSDIEQIRAVIEEMIDSVPDLFGDLSGLLRNSDRDLIGLDEKNSKSAVSGDNAASDTDSIHSLLTANGESGHGKHTHTTSDGYDCLTCQACSARTDLSPTSVSRDSGLSVSNNQLFDDDVTTVLTTPSSSPQRQQTEEPRRLYKNSKRTHTSNSPSSTLAVSSTSRHQKLSDISEASHSASLSLEEDHALRSVSGKMAASRTAKERIKKFNKSASGDSQIGSLEDTHCTSSGDESSCGRSSEHNEGDADDDNQSTDESEHMRPTDLLSSGSGEKHDSVDGRGIDEHFIESQNSTDRPITVRKLNSSEARRSSSNMERKSRRNGDIKTTNHRISDDDRPFLQNSVQGTRQVMETNLSSNHRQPREEEFLNEILKRAEPDVIPSQQQNSTALYDKSQSDAPQLSNEEVAFMDELLKTAQEETERRQLVSYRSEPKPVITTKPAAYSEAQYRSPGIRNEGKEIENQGDVSPKGKKLSRRSRHTVSGSTTSNHIQYPRDFKQLSPPSVSNLQSEDWSYVSHQDKKTPLVRRHTDNAVRAQRRRELQTSNDHTVENYYQPRYYENHVRDYEALSPYYHPTGGFRPRRSNDDCGSIGSRKSVASQTDNIESNKKITKADNQSRREQAEISRSLPRREQAEISRSLHGTRDAHRPIDNHAKKVGQSQTYVSRNASNRPVQVDTESTVFLEYKDSAKPTRRDQNQQQQAHNSAARRYHTDIQRRDVLQAKSVHEYMERNRMKVEGGNRQLDTKSATRIGSNEVESGSKSIADYIKSREQEIQLGGDQNKRIPSENSKYNNGKKLMLKPKTMSLDLADEYKPNPNELTRRRAMEAEKIGYYKEPHSYRIGETRPDLSNQGAIKVIFPDALIRQSQENISDWNQRQVQDGTFEVSDKNRPVRDERILVSKPVQRSNSKDECSYVNVSRISRFFEKTDGTTGEPEEFYYQPSEEQLSRPREAPRSKAARSTSLGRKYNDTRNKDMGVRKRDLEVLDTQFKSLGNVNQNSRNVNASSYRAERTDQRYSQDDRGRSEVVDLRKQRSNWSPVHIPNSSVETIKKSFESSKPPRANLPPHGRERPMAGSIDSKRIPRQDSISSRISSTSEDRKQVTVVSITNSGNTYIRQRDTSEGTTINTVVPAINRSVKTASIDGGLSRPVSAATRTAAVSSKPPHPQLLQGQRQQQRHAQHQRQRQQPPESQQQYQEQKQQHTQQQQQKLKQQQPVQQRTIQSDVSDTDYWDSTAMSGNVQKLRTVYSPPR